MKIADEFPIGQDFLYIHSFPVHKITIVSILGYWDDGKHIYIKKESGGSDSTTAGFLCPITGKLKELIK